jgi:hypothetical protein
LLRPFGCISFSNNSGENLAAARIVFGCRNMGTLDSLGDVRMVAGGGFEPLSGIDNMQLTDYTMGQKGEKSTMSIVTVQIQYKIELIVRAVSPAK